MPKPTCQLNLTLDLATAEWIERIARDVNIRPSGAGRVLLEERLALEDLGWKIGDRELGTLLESIVALEGQDLQSVKDFVGRLGAK
jgi:hypothetical protein